MEADCWSVQLIDGVARCTMNTPWNLNAMSRDLLYPMAEGIKALVRDDSVRVIVIRGEGGNFCSGADLSLLGPNMDPVFLCEAMKLANAAIYDIHDGLKPVIAEVDGYAVGGGLSLALAADITYATERALFVAGWIRIAGVPDLGGSYLLVERVGLARAKEFAYTGRPISANEALQCGIVNKVVDHDRISDEVMELAKKLARQPAAALAWTKRALNAGRRLDLQSVMDMEAHVQPIALLSTEHKQAVEKFFKRQE